MIEVELISPVEMVKRTKAKMVVVPAIEGEIGVLRNHTPFSSPIKPGTVKLYDGDDHVSQTFYVEKGFVNVTAGKCTILADVIKTNM